ncbi:MAG: hypothetical protein QG597_4095, partial [Actinomycetota bacterium]|nr:hypothetical protein [Actinomycetota bacterium]
DRADDDLRALLATADPTAGSPATVPTGLFDRVAAEIADGHGGAAGSPAGGAGSWPGRHWQSLLWAAASVATIALAAAMLVPGLVASGGADQATVTRGNAEMAVPGSAGDSAAVAPVDPGAPMADSTGAPTAGDATTSAPALARTATMLVGSDDIDAARDGFVAEVTAMGGRVMSESVVTAGGDATDVMPADSTVSSDAMYPGSYPYPWYPTGPGVWLNVEVPVAQYDRAVAAAQASGQVVRLEQSTTDVTAQKADTDARIAALEASLARLTALLAQATSVSDVVAVEAAIATRQAELDSLRAQQTELANQTQMSRISLTLMSPEDATASIAPSAPTTWWDSFLAGLSQFWAWLGRALLIVSPLLLAAAIVGWARRRRKRAEPEGPAAANT